jgi:hypothetical protein
MHMIIEVSSFACGAKGECLHRGGPEQSGHAFIEVRDATKPMWARRPPWASLEFTRTPFTSATEALRFAVAQLDANLRAQTLDATDDDYAELLG